MILFRCCNSFCSDFVRDLLASVWIFIARVSVFFMRSSDDFVLGDGLVSLVLSLFGCGLRRIPGSWVAYDGKHFPHFVLPHMVAEYISRTPYRRNIMAV